VTQGGYHGLLHEPRSGTFREGPLRAAVLLRLAKQCSGCWQQQQQQQEQQQQEQQGCRGRHMGIHTSLKALQQQQPLAAAAPRGCLCYVRCGAAALATPIPHKDSAGQHRSAWVRAER
jgi:hypothetical protein